MMGKYNLPALTTILWACLPVFAWAQKKSTVSKSPAKPIVAAPVPEAPKWTSYEILDNGDTINRLDAKGIRQGRWLLEHPAHYEEPAFMEVGSYEQGLKTGLWRTHQNNGVLVSEENFKKGLKDGEARYFEEGQLLCVGHYLALNAQQLYDTVLVEQANTEVLKPVVVKTDVGSVRHGIWTYYEPPSKEIKRLVEYQADDIVFDTTYTRLTHQDTLFMQQKMKTLPHANTKATAGDWIDTKNRKRIKYTDLPDNMTEVKPNVRKK